MRDRNSRIDRRTQKKRGPGTRFPWLVAGGLVLVVFVVVAALVFKMGRYKEGGSVASSNPERVGPLEVSATRIDLGHVPLNQWVNPTFHLSNVSAEPVTITIPRQGVETLEGC